MVIVVGKTTQDLVVDSICLTFINQKGIFMKKLLVVALLAASFVSMSEARRCGRVCKTECAPVCEAKAECIAPARICDVTYSCDKSEDCKPELCAVVPQTRHLDKHVHRTEHVSYSCRPLTGCEQPPSEEQLNAWRLSGKISKTCGG